MIILSDDFIDSLFAGTNFGDPINECVNNKRSYLKVNLRYQTEGYWCGSTMYSIMVEGGFLIDGEKGTKKKLTAIGRAFCEQ